MIRIIADTTSTITPDEASALDIFLLPQIIVFGENSYRDDRELTTEDFLLKLRSSSVLPKTAAPPPSLYTPIFQQVTKNNDSVIVLCPSSRVSGTFRNALVAAQDFPKTDIRVVDTEVIGPALGTIVRNAQISAKSGISIDTIIGQAVESARRVKIYFYVDTLEYLHKGGRIGNAKALLGSILQIKPILLFKDGQVNQFETQRTKKKAIDRIIELVRFECPPTLEASISILEADAMEGATSLKCTLSEMMMVNNITITNLPPAIIVHAGPGVIAVSFFIAS